MQPQTAAPDSRCCAHTHTWSQGGKAGAQTGLLSPPVGGLFVLIPSGDGADKHTAESSQARSHNSPSLASLCVFFFSIREDKESEKFRLSSAGGREGSVGDAAPLPSRGEWMHSGAQPGAVGSFLCRKPRGKGSPHRQLLLDLRGFCAHLCRPETFPYTALRAGGSQGSVLLSKERCESCSPQPAPNWPWLCRRAQP